ncbi:DUF2225 domain-containing protein [Bacillus marinisedimentorum]|uniref:DUF2225 domain-containing protein n=1 Tax=Bacillus marinisedimentorum TaxID=1821260 RepID=UPI0008733620|nr:DUF2225 domain-containing protein [Bacillus marinisedimentorum]
MTQEIQPLYDKTYTCPQCGASYSSKQLRSRFVRTETRDADFCIWYKHPEYDPDLYFIHICPACGFAAGDLSKDTLTDEARIVFRKEVGAKWGQGDSYSHIRTVEKAAETYKLAIYTGKLLQENNQVLGGLCLRAAWVYRKNGDSQNENRFLNMALTHYLESDITGDFAVSGMSEMRLHYLIGELYRRLDQGRKAIPYFSKVLHHKNKAYEPQLAEAARTQYYLIKEGDTPPKP